MCGIEHLINKVIKMAPETLESVEIDGFYNFMYNG